MGLFYVHERDLGGIGIIVLLLWLALYLEVLMLLGGGLAVCSEFP